MWVVLHARPSASCRSGIVSFFFGANDRSESGNVPQREDSGAKWTRGASGCAGYQQFLAVAPSMVATTQAGGGIFGGRVDHAKTKWLNVERVVTIVVMASLSQPGTPIAPEI